MKLNKKGFMMAEVVVVSAIVLIVLTALYVSYNKLYSVYNTRLNYYDVVSLYRLGYYRDILIENKDNGESIINNLMYNQIEDGNAINLTDENFEFYSLVDKEVTENNKSDTVYFVNNNKGEIIITDEISVTFQEYITFLNNSHGNKFDSDYIMVMERCNIIDEEVDVDNCKYAYLEVYDE